jgi:TusA-related sulfurtransferase
MMKTKVLNTIGLKSPEPIMKLTTKLPYMNTGDILEVVGDCPMFEEDVLAWCERLGKLVLSVKNNGKGAKRIQVQV